MVQSQTDKNNIKPNTFNRSIKIQEMFERITPRYDLLNRLLSARRDVYWRHRTTHLLPEQCKRVLDCAAGSGDLTIEIAKRCPDADVIGLDFVYKMLKLAKNKTSKADLVDHIKYVTGDANCLPYADDDFDVVTIAFGLRNIPDRSAAINEMKRVVRSGGKVIVLEMTYPENIGMQWFFKWYLNKIIPVLGGLISRGGAYKYLSDSIQDFLSPDEMNMLFTEAGLTDIQAHRLTGGICYIHEGTVV